SPVHALEDPPAQLQSRDSEARLALRCSGGYLSITEVKRPTDRTTPMTHRASSASSLPVQIFAGWSSRFGATSASALDLSFSSSVPRMFGCGATVTTTCPFLCPFSTYLWAS